MADARRSRVFITTWPGRPLEQRQVRKGTFRLDPSGRFLLPWSVFAESITPQEDTYLRLGQLDLDDLGAIEQFVDRYGRLNLYDRDADSWPAFAKANLIGDFGVVVDLESGLRRERGAAQAAYDAILPERCEAASELGFPPEMLSRHADEAGVETLLEFRLAARFFRDAATAVRLLRGDIRPDRVRWAWPEAHGFGGENDTSEGANSTGDAAAVNRQPAVARVLIEKAVSIAADYLAPAVYFAWVQKPSEEPSGELRLRPIPLWASLSLGLFNHLARNAPYKVCANERCRNLLTRKETRVVAGDLREGRPALYCSERCEHRRNQNEYRRRRKAKTEAKRAAAEALQ